MQKEQYTCFAFDVDGTIAEPYEPLGSDIAQALCKLSEQGNVLAFVTGRGFENVRDSIVAELSCSPEKVYILSSSGGELYEKVGTEWDEIFNEEIDAKTRQHIGEIFIKILYEVDPALLESGERHDVFSKGGSIVSCTSLAPQHAPKEVRYAWDQDRQKRREIVARMQKLLPDFELRIGGGTTIDVTKKGVSKASGLRTFFEHTGINPRDVVYFGDGLFPGGNDYDVIETDVDTIAVTDPEDCLSKLKVIAEERS